jgi:hypothetical protein
MIVTVFHRLVILLLVILLFNVIVDINIGVLAYLTQFINTLKCENDVCTYANAKIIYEKCFQLKKKSHNHLKSPGIFFRKNEFVFQVFFELHWVLPYHALNSEFPNFETPCIRKCQNVYNELG